MSQLCAEKTNTYGSERGRRKTATAVELSSSRGQIRFMHVWTGQRERKSESYCTCSRARSYTAQLISLYVCALCHISSVLSGFGEYRIGARAIETGVEVRQKRVRVLPNERKEGSKLRASGSCVASDLENVIPFVLVRHWRGVEWRARDVFSAEEKQNSEAGNPIPNPAVSMLIRGRPCMHCRYTASASATSQTAHISLRRPDLCARILFCPRALCLGCALAHPQFDFSPERRLPFLL